MSAIQARLRSVLRPLSRAVSTFVVRPELDRMLMLLSEPMIESAAYTSRALRDVEARLAPAADDVAAMLAFRELPEVGAGKRVLVVGRVPVLLERALAAHGCAVTRVDPEAAPSFSPAQFDSVLAFDARAPEAWGLRPLPVDGVEVSVGARR